ncbi:MAG: hypothetical protein R3E31_08355 [Chloroflexota bacterium]
MQMPVRCAHSFAFTPFRFTISHSEKQQTRHLANGATLRKSFHERPYTSSDETQSPGGCHREVIFKRDFTGGRRPPSMKMREGR